MGQTLVIVSGSFDLSQGSIAGLAAMGNGQTVEKRWPRAPHRHCRGVRGRPIGDRVMVLKGGERQGVLDVEDSTLEDVENLIVRGRPEGSG